MDIIVIRQHRIVINPGMALCFKEREERLSHGVFELFHADQTTDKRLTDERVLVLGCIATRFLFMVGCQNHSS